jgi:hypothetical protein
MTLFEQLQQMDERMHRSFEKKRMGTFNQLLADRLLLLKKARRMADSEAFLELAQKQSEVWRGLLKGRMEEYRRNQSNSKAMNAYGKHSSRAGRIFTRSG